MGQFQLKAEYIMKLTAFESNGWKNAPKELGKMGTAVRNMKGLMERSFLEAQKTFERMKEKLEFI